MPQASTRATRYASSALICPPTRLSSLDLFLLQLHRLAAAADADVQHLDDDRERHREVDVALRNVHVDALGDQRHADQHEEREREHLDRRVLVDEAPDTAGGEHHDRDGQDYRDDHYGDVVGQADGRDHGIQRENDINEADLDDRAHEARVLDRVTLAFRTLEAV